MRLRRELFRCAKTRVRVPWAGSPCHEYTRSPMPRPTFFIVDGHAHIYRGLLRAVPRPHEPDGRADEGAVRLHANAAEPRRDPEARLPRRRRRQRRGPDVPQPDFSRLQGESRQGAARFQAAGTAHPADRRRQRAADVQRAGRRGGRRDRDDGRNAQGRLRRVPRQQGQRPAAGADRARRHVRPQRRRGHGRATLAREGRVRPGARGRGADADRRPDRQRARHPRRRREDGRRFARSVRQRRGHLREPRQAQE